MLELNFDDLYKLSLSQPEKVWDEIAKEVVWNKPYSSVIKDKNSPITKWFVDGEINMSYNCLDKHIQDGYGDDLAVIYECPITNTTDKVTYGQLLKLVELFSGVMVNKCNVRKGDRVLLYFPPTIQGLVSMLACTRIGAIYVTVFGGFAPDLIAARIKHTEPKLIITSNVAFEQEKIVNYKENIDIAIEKSKFIPDNCIVYNRPNTQWANMINCRDLDWETEISQATPHGPVSLESDHPIFIIYTSGTTGEPKGFVMRTGTLVVANKYFMKYILGLTREECWWMPSDFGWISGQTMMTYGPLLTGSSTILYEGNSIGYTELERIMNRNNIVGFSSTPTNMRILRNECLEKDIKPSIDRLRFICIGGELSNTELRKWISEVFSCPVYNLWGQTELGILSNGPGLGFKRSNYDAVLPMLSVNPKIVNSETGDLLPNETIGRVLLKLPICPSAAFTMYKDHDRFIETYFSRYTGYYDTKDYGMLMNDGSLQVIGRADDIIHVSSTRICGGALEEVCLKNENLVNAAFVGLDDPLNGQIPFAFLEARKNQNINHKTLIEEIIKLVDNEIGTFTFFANAVFVPKLPKTKTGKVLRKTLSAMLNGHQWKIPKTTENTKTFEEIYIILIQAGYKPSLPDYE